MNILIGLLTLGSPTFAQVPPVSDNAVAMARCHPFEHKVHGCGRDTASMDADPSAEREAICRQLPGKLRMCDMRVKSGNGVPQEMRVENAAQSETDG